MSDSKNKKIKQEPSIQIWHEALLKEVFKTVQMTGRASSMGGHLRNIEDCVVCY
jgi:hypothetical protein